MRCHAVGSSGSPGALFDRSEARGSPPRAAAVVIAMAPARRGTGAGGGARVAQGTLPTIVSSGSGACGPPAGGGFGLPGSPGDMGAWESAGGDHGLRLPLFLPGPGSGNPGPVAKVVQQPGSGRRTAENASHFTSASGAGMIGSLSGGHPADDTFSSCRLPGSPQPEKRKNVAGWSSPVAREAHNLEVTGSNPVPAISRPAGHPWPRRAVFLRGPGIQPGSPAGCPIHGPAGLLFCAGPASSRAGTRGAGAW